MAQHAIDCFYPDPDHPGSDRRISAVIEAKDDAEAVLKGRDHASWNSARYFKIWSVEDGASRLLFDSEKGPGRPEAVLRTNTAPPPTPS